MLSAEQMASLRPGIARGDYPEREPDEATALDRLARTLSRPLRGELRPPRLHRFVNMVDAAGDAIDPRVDFREPARELRRELRDNGLTARALARSFALVRAASERKLGMRHYDTQLMAGRVLMGGGLAEVETGEGKTLAATLPACTAALAGIPVHVVTANDYLVARDAAAMAPVYRALGLSVGAITAASTAEMRRQAYRRSITYTTAPQLAFDYLRDRLAMGPQRSTVHRRLRQLLDGDGGNPHGLLMRGLCFAILDEADSLLIDEARTPFIIARERETTEIEQRSRRALAIAASLTDRDYTIDHRRRRAELTDSGAHRVDGEQGLDATPRLRRALVEQALSALSLFLRDRDYIVRDGAIEIVDPNTGRVLSDRSWDRGLHQMVECKESCAVTAPRETLARLTYQRLFRRYLHLSGMTGTAREVHGELRATYALRFAALPTHRPGQRRRLTCRVTADRATKWKAIVAHTRAVHDTGRPVLIGTRSVSDSETLSRLLGAAGLHHAVLNARQDADEAQIIALAGQRDRITVATNMAGRGTDIALGPGVRELGGLHVIAAEPNDAGRLDRQLSGRCGRQGDPGTHVMFHAPDDELLRSHCPSLLRWVLRRLAARETLLARLMSNAVTSLAQRRCERYHRLARRNLSIMQDQMDRLLALSGPQE